MNKIINGIGQASVAFALFVGAWYTISAFAHWAHEKHCEGTKTGHCGWAWCKHYDGSDRLHDFNF